LAVVGVSDWITNEARKSFFKSARIVKRIYNWIDLDIFKPVVITDFREKLGIADKFLILGVSSVWTDDKGINDFIKLAEIIDDKSVIVLVGKCKEALPPNIINIPSTDDSFKLAEMYSSADVFVHLSKFETFGKVIAEAISCGTPAVVYDTATAFELIGRNCGHIAALGNIKEVVSKIGTVKFNGKSFYTESCLRFALENFDYRKNTLKYIDLFNKMMS
jgi:glycosyltransferase involved in cell wall biosynthesis